VKILSGKNSNNLNDLLENKDYSMENCKRGLMSKNLIQRYKAKQFTVDLSDVDE